MKRSLVVALLCVSAAHADGLVVTEDLRAGAKLNPELVRPVKIPEAMKRAVVSPDSISYLKDARLRFAVKKGDLVLWSAFFISTEHLDECAEALLRARK